MRERERETGEQREKNEKRAKEKKRWKNGRQKASTRHGGNRLQA